MPLRRGLGETKLYTVSAGTTVNVAGDATLNAPAGSTLVVKRNPEDLDVRVSSGLVNVVSPAGSQRLEHRLLQKVPIHTIVASVPSNSPHARRVGAPRHPNDPMAA